MPGKRVDDLWEVEDLLPSTPKRRTWENRKASLSDEGLVSPSASKNEPIPARQNGEDCLFSYTPENPFIQKISVFRWRSPFPYYEDFYRDARKWYPYRCGEAEKEEFFSYVPQYSQMNHAQLKWYIFWRDRIRHGEAIATGYSYILLFIYEIINLSGKEIEGKRGLHWLCFLWKSYASDYPNLNKIMPDWIADYCMIHQLPPPPHDWLPVTGTLDGFGSFREFYLSSFLKGEPDYYESLMVLASSYNYRASKYYNDKTGKLFETYMPEALKIALENTEDGRNLVRKGGLRVSVMNRDAFAGAPCVFSAKRRLLIEYTSVSGCQELRFFLGDVIRLSENRIRGLLNIRSRLSVNALPSSVERAVHAFFDRAFADDESELIRRALSEKDEKNEAYAGYYEAPAKDFSVTDAHRIETESWETTKKLVDAFEEAPPETNPEEPAPEAAPKEPEQEKETPEEGLWMGKYRRFLEFLLKEDGKGFAALAKSQGLFPVSVAEEINTLACEDEEIGDILIEVDRDEFRLLEDYRDWVEEKLKNG